MKKEAPICQQFRVSIISKNACTEVRDMGCQGFCSCALPNKKDRGSSTTAYNDLLGIDNASELLVLPKRGK